MVKKNVWIVIAAYNESKKIGLVIKSLKSQKYRNIVVVDDGSRDDTFDQIKKSGVVALRHVMNRGQGAALKTGIDYALSKGADVIVTFDADGQHLAEEISQVAGPIISGKAEVALGSRFLKKRSNVPWIRMLMLKGGALLFYILYGVKVTDSHNGFRALSRKAAKAIDIKSDGMEHASEIVEEVAKKRLKYVEVPVTIKYTDDSMSGSTHGGGLSSLFSGIKIVFKMLMKKLMS